MHIFLTGEIQVGKTTIIRKILANLGAEYGGFKTYFGPDRGSEDRFLYISAANEPDHCRVQNAIVKFRKAGEPLVMDEKFDTVGVELIRTARQTAKLIVMDECGNLERQAVAFQDEILKTLNQDVPVLGVIKLASSGWTDLIRNHQQVKLITVTKENREALAEILAHHFALIDQ